jgi:putative spermidine/putrescine transport system permease protein
LGIGSSVRRPGGPRPPAGDGWGSRAGHLSSAALRWLKVDASAVAGIPAVVYFVIGYAFPLALMVAISLDAPNWSFANYTSLQSSGVFGPLIWNTVRITLLVGAAALLLGFPYAYAMSRAPTRLAALLGATMLFPFLVSSVVRSFTWVFILEPGGVVPKAMQLLGISHPPILLGTQAGVVIGLTQIELPFVVFPIYAALTAVKPEYRAAAAALGANGLRSFLRLTLPLSMPGVAVGGLLSIVYSLGSYITPELLGGQGSTMIGQGIALEVQFSLSWGQASAMGTVLLVGTGIVLLAGARIGGERLLTRT